MRSHNVLQPYENIAYFCKRIPLLDMLTLQQILQILMLQTYVISYQFRDAIYPVLNGSGFAKR